ncbi:MAG: hypothetical protein M3O02_06305, partial [Acidobacteriota bacterium]|nr:hypothetical protein [Acidobacteriota bacterium]
LGPAAVPAALLALSLAAAVSSNYYGVLAWSPIALGELVRSLRARRIAPAPWLALAAGALPLLAYLPLIRHNIAEFTPHAWNRANPHMLADSYLVLVEGLVWPVLAGALLLAWRIRQRPPRAARPAEPHASAPASPAYAEGAALATLLLYPVLGLVVAFAGAGMISSRCVLPVCCGFALAAALLASTLSRGRPRTAVLLLCAALVWVVARQAACAMLLAEQRTAFLALRDQLDQQPPGGDTPILLADSNLALPLAHYSRPALAARLLYPIDFAAIHASEPDDSGEQNLWACRGGILPLRIVPYTQELAATPALVLSRPAGWLTQRLARDGARVREITTPIQATLFGRLGGVFTPLAHDRTRLLSSLPPAGE